MNTDLLFVILRNTHVNGVLVEKDRFIKVTDRLRYAEAEVQHLNDQIANVSKELVGIEVLYFIKTID